MPTTCAPNDAAESVSRILTETTVDLKTARDEIHAATGRRVDVTTLWRWTQRGVKGKKLDSCKLGRVVLTSREAIHRFLVEQTG